MISSARCIQARASIVRCPTVRMPVPTTTSDPVLPALLVMPYPTGGNTADTPRTAAVVARQIAVGTTRTVAADKPRTAAAVARQIAVDTPCTASADTGARPPPFAETSQTY